MTYTTHTHNLCRRTRTTQARRYASDTVVAEEAGKTAREGRPAGWGGGWDGVEGQVLWRAGCCGGPGRVAGRVGWRAGWGGWQGGVAGLVVGGGWIFREKNVLE